MEYKNENLLLSDIENHFNLVGLKGIQKFFSDKILLTFSDILFVGKDEVGNLFENLPTTKFLSIKFLSNTPEIIVLKQCQTTGWLKAKFCLESFQYTASINFHFEFKYIKSNDLYLISEAVIKRQFQNTEDKINSVAEYLRFSYLKKYTKNLLSKLTTREDEIYRLIIDGLTNSEVSEKLNISVSTTEYHRSKIMEKLNIKKAVELSRFDFFRY